MSGRKNQLPAYQTITAGDMTGDLTSEVTNINYLDNVGVQINFTGTPVGTFAAQVSADYEQDTLGNVTNAGNWIAVPLTYWGGSAFTTALSVPTSVGSPIYLDLNQLSAPWVRTTYTAGSSVGVANVFVTAKMV